MFERFTGKARQVIVEAQNEARGFNHDYIGTEHLLLGLLDIDGVASSVLTEFGVSAQTVREEVIAIVGQGETAPAGHIPFTPRAKKVLELALREAIELDNDYIGTEHILLGIVREGDGVAAQVLAHRGVDLPQTRAAVVRRGGSGELPETSKVGATFGRVRARMFRDAGDPRQLRAENARLRALLERHGIDPDEGVS